jgi:hypothetical protein
MVGVHLLYIYLDCVKGLKEIIGELLDERKKLMKGKEKKNRDKASGMVLEFLLSDNEPAFIHLIRAVEA